MPNLTVLIIDDSANFVNALATQLVQSGYNVQSVTEGHTGLQMARVLRPGAVIVDAQVPGLSGLEVCKRIKTDPELKEIPVIMLNTSQPADKEHEHDRRVAEKEHLPEADVTLSKPMPATEVVEQVDRIISSAQSRQERPPAVLVIDDDVATLRLFEHVLAREGFQVTTRTSAETALKELDVAEFDLILLDFKMAGMDGIQALQEIRKATEEAAVVIVTGHSSESVAIEAIRHDADDYVTKPPQVQQMSAMAARNLAKARLRKERARLLAQLKENAIQLACNYEETQQRNRELREALEKLRNTQEELVEAQRLAAVTQTAITVNHEINNPLAAIVGNVHFLLTDGSVTSPRALERLQMIQEQCMRIRDTTHKLTRVTQTVTTEYARGIDMLDLDASTQAPSNQTSNDSTTPPAERDDLRC